LLTDSGEFDFPRVESDGQRLWLEPAGLERATGWALKPEGLCKAEVCVPIPPKSAWAQAGRIDVAGFWRHLCKPVIRSDDGAAWSLGEGARDRAAALRSLEAPDFELPDPSGRSHRLSDHRGKKVLLVTWASW
jgi:hypothetical protein